MGVLNIHPGLHWKTFATELRQFDWSLGWLDSLVGCVTGIFYYSLPLSKGGLSVIYHHYLYQMWMTLSDFWLLFSTILLASPWQQYQSGFGLLWLLECVAFHFSFWQLSFIFATVWSLQHLSNGFSWETIIRLWLEGSYTYMKRDLIFYTDHWYHMYIDRCLYLICLSVYL